MKLIIKIKIISLSGPEQVMSTHAQSLHGCQTRGGDNFFLLAFQVLGYSNNQIGITGEEFNFLQMIVPQRYDTQRQLDNQGLYTFPSGRGIGV